MSSASQTQSTGLSKRYATALYELADEQGVLNETIDEMGKLGQLIEEAPGLRRLIGSPMIDVKTGSEAMEAVLAEQGFSPLVRHFVGVVTGNRRLRDLPGLIAGFADFVADRRGVITAEVATAHKLTDTQRAQLTARLAQSGYGRIALHETVEPSLLGGMTLKIGARLYDTSLKSRLQRLSYAMKGIA